MKVCIYACASFGQQELEQQVLGCKKFCEGRGLDVSYVYLDAQNAEKAEELQKRENFSRMKNALLLGRHEGVVVFRLERLGRNLKELVDFMHDAGKAGASVFSVGEQFDTTSPMDAAAKGAITVVLKNGQE
jgi:DNA invertase Pin-like site-specific DNA recombinase